MATSSPGLSCRGGLCRSPGCAAAKWTARSTSSRSRSLAVAIVPLFANWQSASRAGQTDTADFAADLLNSVEPYGILVTSGDNDTFPLWYAQEVEGIRRDVIVACLSLLNTDWYTRQLVRRPIYAYDSLRGPAAYRGRVWKRPSGPPLNLTMEQADAVPSVIELSAPQTFRKEGTDIVVNIQPRSLGDFAGLERADLFVLYMIRDAYPGRPFNFSRTTGGYPEEMGFAPYTITTGLARKLVPDIPKAGNGIVVSAPITTHGGAVSFAPGTLAAINSTQMMPIVFCASLPPCPSE